MLTGKNSEPSNILEPEDFSTWPLTADDLRRLWQYREDATRFEPGKAYPLHRLDEYLGMTYPCGRPYVRHREPSVARDELFIKGGLD